MILRLPRTAVQAALLGLVVTLASGPCRAAPASAKPAAAQATAPAKPPVVEADDPDDDDPQQVLLVGDSMMRVGVGPVLRRTLEDALGADVTMHAKSATGLSRPDAYDWPAALKEVLTGRRFDQAVVFLGSNDCQDMTGAADVLEYGTPEWNKTYRARVKDLLGQLCGATDKVYWLELPPMRSPRFNTKIAALNGLLSAEVKASKCAHFISLAGVLSGPKGAYLQFQPLGKKKKKKIREDDGIHITQNGGRLVTDVLLKLLK